VTTDRSNYEFSSLIESVALNSAKALALAGLVTLLAFASATLLDGLLRHLIGRPIELVRDSGGLIVALSVTSCFPLALLQRANISIKFLDLWIPTIVARLLDAVASGVVWIVFFFSALEFYLYARDLARANEVTVMLNVPKAPFWYAVDAFLWVAVAVQTLVVIVDCIKCLRPTGVIPPAPAITGLDDAI
jgi:tripartite ATP-independent transporter DctQ subunit